MFPEDDISTLPFFAVCKFNCHGAFLHANDGQDQVRLTPQQHGGYLHAREGWWWIPWCSPACRGGWRSSPTFSRYPWQQPLICRILESIEYYSIKEPSFLFSFRKIFLVCTSADWHWSGLGPVNQSQSVSVCQYHISLLLNLLLYKHTTYRRRLADFGRMKWDTSPGSGSLYWEWS